MPWTVRLTRAQAHRLITLYGYSGDVDPVIDRLTAAALCHLRHAPQGPPRAGHGSLGRADLMGLTRSG